MGEFLRLRVPCIGNNPRIKYLVISLGEFRTIGLYDFQKSYVGGSKHYLSIPLQGL